MSVMALEAAARCGCGYEFMEAAREEGWQPVAGWGADGWDLLDWPYHIALVRHGADAEKPYGLLTYCEGDLHDRWFPSAAARETAINELALAHWTRRGEAWVEREPADRLRGPYRRDRA